MRKLNTYLFAFALSLAMTLPSAAQPVLLSNGMARELALRYSEDLKKTVNDSVKAELDLRTARASWLPTVDGTGTGIYLAPDMDMMGMTLQMKGMYLAGIMATQPVFAGGKIVAGGKLAKIGREAAAEKVRSSRAQAIADADKAYWGLLSVQRKVDMLRAYAEQMDSLLSKVELSLSAEMATRSDLMRVKSKRSEIAYQLQKASGGEELCRMALCEATGLPLDTELELTDTLITITPPGELSADLSRRPEMRLLSLGVEAGRQQVRMQRGDMLPQIGLVGAYTYYGGIKVKGYTQDATGSYVPYENSIQDGMFAGMLSVKVPIFHWGTERRKVRKAKLDLENAQLDLEKNSSLMDMELRQAVQNVTDGYNLVQTATYGLEEADENLRIMKEKYGADMATMTDLLDAQSQWRTAQSNLIEAQASYLMARTDYLKACGLLD